MYMYINIYPERKREIESSIHNIEPWKCRIERIACESSGWWGMNGNAKGGERERRENEDQDYRFMGRPLRGVRGSLALGP